MKKDNHHIEKEVDKVMSSFDEVSPVRPKPFFYSRLKARMDNRSEVQTAPTAYSLSRVRVMAVVTALLLLVNVVTITRYLGGSTEGTAGAAVSDAGEVFIEAYYPETPTIYTIDENLTP